MSCAYPEGFSKLGVIVAWLEIQVISGIVSGLRVQRAEWISKIFRS